MPQRYGFEPRSRTIEQITPPPRMSRLERARLRVAVRRLLAWGERRLAPSIHLKED